jgi:DNA-binding GntR family transcriptional regulator
MHAITVYDELRDLIVAGELPAKVSETQLAERLNVSRTPIREALERLHGDGLVDAHGRGVRLIELDARQLRAVYRVRAALEALTAELVAERQQAGEIAPAALAALERLNAAADEATRNGDLTAGAAHNRAFHLRIAELADNPPALDALQRIWDQIVISTKRSLVAPKRANAVDKEHRRLLDAIQHGDPQTAAEAAKTHVLNTLKEFDVAHA